MWRCHPGLLPASPLILQGGQTFKLPPQSTPLYPPPSPDSLPHFPLKLCLRDVSGQCAGFWSYRLGCAALAGGGAVGRVGFGLLLQASFPPPPLTLGGAGLNSRTPPVCTHKRPCRGSCSLGVAEGWGTTVFHPDPAVLGLPAVCTGCQPAPLPPRDTLRVLFLTQWLALLPHFSTK